MNEARQCARERSRRVAAGITRERTATNGHEPRRPAGARAPATSRRAPPIRLRSFSREWRRDAGLALPAVIAVGAAVAALTGTWFEAALTESRRTRALSDRLVAFHAADAALAACTARLRRGSAPYVSERDSHAEPDAWRRMPALVAAEAFAPFAGWPMAAQPPRCLIEAWRGAGPAGGRAYVVTARGVGAHASSAVWLQHQVAIREGRIVMLRWRRVATVLR
jgi:Tfp pilus assembly protein PilX